MSESSKDWTKELRSISWNDKEAKYDIRDWSEDYERMGKGITLSKEEIVALRDFLNGLEL
ncbi:YdbC family protein [Paenibacillus sediminis]|uniref:YdbC family protein n=1 Tax=Paenibacillus sediminis TaxID=664909 RepID=UPI001FD84511|nr:PC4/YdbC family ssDNA-binding protein [Paenibacillus sediminis]